MLELAGCLLKQNGDTEGCLTFDPTNAEQGQAVIRAAGLKARRIASPAQLAVLASMAQLRSVAHAPLEGGGSKARTHSMTQHTVAVAEQ